MNGGLIEISAINDHAGIKPITVSQETFTVLKAARQLGERSDGAFDPTWAALRGIWRFDLIHLNFHYEACSKRRSNRSDMNTVLDESKSTVFLKAKGAALGLGAIAKAMASTEQSGAAILWTQELHRGWRW